jgi:hypothetical protein
MGIREGGIGTADENVFTRLNLFIHLSHSAEKSLRSQELEVEKIGRSWVL